MNRTRYFFIGLLLCSCQANESNKEVQTGNIEPMILDDPHSFAKPSESLVTHLDWRATVDFETKIISGTAILSLQNSKDASQLILDTKLLSIESVIIGGEPVEYNLGEIDEYLGQSLSIKITPQTKNVSVHYKTSKDAEALQWLAPSQTADKKSPFLFTQSQAILARSWVPIQDSPGIRFTYNAEVTVPQGLLALMSAENPATVNESGVYNFEMKQPIPAYLLALSVGQLEFKSLGVRSGVYAEPTVINAAAYEFEDLEVMIKAAENLYGPYRWDRYDLLVLPPSFPFGGMENPRLTFATPTILAGDRSLVSLVAHELAHSWSGNLVTNANWNDFWLNEGFTVYFEQRIMETLYGRDYSEMLAALSVQGLKEDIETMIKAGNSNDTKLKLDLENRNPDDGVTSIAYDKGYLLLRNIEEKLGREKFDAFLKGYFEKNAFRVMTTEQFIVQFEQYAHEEDFSFDLNQWIYDPGIPKGASLPISDRFLQIDNALQAFMNGAKAGTLEVKDWTSHEWLHFVRAIPANTSFKQMEDLDNAFSFTVSGNSEVLTGWLIQAVSHQYTPAYERLEKFLMNTGRRKFLSPIYGELIKSESGKEMALNIYKKARPNYHFVATNTLDEMLGFQSN